MHDDTPALLGGHPVRPGGPPMWPLPDAGVLEALRTAYGSGSWGQYLGPNVPALEAKLAEIHGVAHAVTCASGTLSVEIALRALGVGPRDEVILGAYDFEASFLSIHAIGAQPVLVDVAPDNASLDPTGLEAAITPATRAVIATHLHGGLVPMPEVVGIAGRHGVPVLEDAAQATGATVAGKPAGSWGDVGVLSFGGSKLVTAGRGGAILTNRPDIHQRARLILSRGIQQWGPMSELQAAVAVAQLNDLAGRTAHRAARTQKLLHSLRDVPGLRPFTNRVPDSRPAYYKLGFSFDEESFGLSRDLFVKAVRAEGVAFDPGFRALYVGRAAGRYRAAGQLPHAETAGRTVVGLHHPVLGLGEADVEQVAAAVRKTYRNRARLRDAFEPSPPPPG
ncbi:MAG TPA: aminotransferase class V-fold PLP-dependent enzyme [Gemmataceae bacterium]|nr:aminotransferase class V-fold PLP-dependent enzyme [Gemmataceae bacterium]